MTSVMFGFHKDTAFKAADLIDILRKCYPL